MNRPIGTLVGQDACCAPAARAGRAAVEMGVRAANCLDGEWRPAGDGRTYGVENPADLRQIWHRYPLSGAPDVQRAIGGAVTAFAGWRRTSLGERVRILRQAAQLLRERRTAIALVITRENGKLLAESLTEIDAAALELEFQIGEGERQFGRTGDCYRPGLMAFSRKEPLGVVSVIVPWNFPFNVPWRKIAPALMAGNTVVFKPARQTPAVGEAVVQLLLDAGIPPGVLQFVTGAGPELSEALVGDPRIRAVTFTGSTAVGRQIARRAAERFTRTQLEMGGKNPMIVLRDADLALAAEDAITGAYSCAGQWCTATSRLIVDARVATELVDRIREGVRKIRVGPGDDPTSTMGPVAGRQQLETVLGHLARARSQGARIIEGGERCVDEGLEHGCFVAPTLIDHVTENLDLAATEIFGPVLAVFRVDGYGPALRLANAVPYGLSSSIYTRDLDRAVHFVEHTAVGLTHVNAHTAYKEPQQCFGGVKESGFGLPEAGSTGIQFFQDEKSVYIKKGKVADVD